MMNCTHAPVFCKLQPATQMNMWTTVGLTIAFVFLPLYSGQQTFDSPNEVKKEIGVSFHGILTLAQNIERKSIEKMPEGGKQIRLDDNKDIHFYIAVDISDVSEKQLTILKGVVTSLIIKIINFDVTPNYDIMFFASDVDEVNNVNDAPDRIVKAVNNYRYMGKREKSGPNISLVFQKISEKMLSMAQKNKEFQNIRNAIIIFTSDVSSEGGNAEQYVKKIKSLVYSFPGITRDDYLEIFIFGIGSKISKTEMDKLVTKKKLERHYFKLQDIDALQGIFDEIDGGDSSVVCGIPHHASDGNDRQKYPWLAKVVTEHFGFQTCLGALVNKKYVLTSASCLQRELTPDKITVDLGGSRPVKVKRFILHPDYNVKAKVEKGIPEFYDYDVALVELEHYVTFLPNLRPICLPCTKETNQALRLSDEYTCQALENLLLSKDLELANFRAASKGGVNREKSATIKLNSQSYNCIKDSTKAPRMRDINPLDIVTDTFLCTGGREGVTDDTVCRGEGGGPLYVTFKGRTIQVGVISWGVENLCPEAKSTETSRDFHINLFRVKDFLKYVLGKDDPEIHPLTFID